MEAETTYRDIYNGPTRALMSRLLDWHIEAARRFGPRCADDLDNAIEACHDIFHEWQRTHETRALARCDGGAAGDGEK